MSEAMNLSRIALWCPLRCLPQFSLLTFIIHVMVYTSPTKVTCIIEWNRHRLPLQEIAQSIGIHHTTVTCILKWFKKSGDYYHKNPKLVDLVRWTYVRAGLQPGWSLKSRLQMLWRYKKRYSPKSPPGQYRGIWRNRGYCVMFRSPSPT